MFSQNHCHYCLLRPDSQSLITMPLPLAVPPPVHVKDYSLCPNPLCCIKISHDFHDLLPAPPIPAGVQQLRISRFGSSNPFPTVNCWKLVSPMSFDPRDEPWVYLPGGFGTVWLTITGIEADGWIMYNAIQDERLIIHIAFPKWRRQWWRWW